MIGFPAAKRLSDLRRCSNFCAASARSTKAELTVRAQTELMAKQHQSCSEIVSYLTYQMTAVSPKPTFSPVLRVRDN